MKLIFWIFLLPLIPIVYFYYIDGYIEENINLLKLVKSYKYPIEKHIVQTEDGYLLDLLRIPHGINGTKPNNKPILLVHGLSGGAGDYVVLGPKKSLGYLLAEQGYDVWMFSARGTQSKEHMYLDESKNKKEFYDFSWHEIGIYDVPATIDYILKKTNKTKLHYLGHSQGTTSFFVMMSMKPEYNQKIRLGVMFAPVIFVEHVNASLFQRIVISNAEFLYTSLNRMRIYHFPLVKYQRIMLQQLCKYKLLFPACYKIYNILGGYENPDQTDLENIRGLLKIFPTNAAYKQAFHYIQHFKTDKFRQFDYGTEKNLQIYGTPEPPDYNLGLVSAPVAFFVGKNDRYGTVEDTKHLQQVLKYKTHLKVVPHDHWNHFDFIAAKDAPKLLYKDVIELLASY